MMLSPYEPHWALYPRSYTVTRAPQAFTVDGNIEKEIWKDVPWSLEFGDIQGGPCAGLTKFKALFDDDFLYIAGILHPVDGLPTQAHFTQRNDPIYQKDSDFEVFIDCDHSNHNYKELEVNAINTVWNLKLDKPYSDGGHEHSGRIAQPGDPDYYEVYDQHTATKVVSGRLNDDALGALWTIELALSKADIGADCSQGCHANYWRINFSRVERKGDINWTWQAQIRWDAASQSFRGFVNMHMPDAWGYLFFQQQPDDEETKNVRDGYWPAKLTAMTVYYALHYYHDQNNSYTDDLEKLVLPKDIVSPFDIVISLSLDGFTVLVNSKTDTTMVKVRDDRLLHISQSDARCNK